MVSASASHQRRGRTLNVDSGAARYESRTNAEARSGSPYHYNRRRRGSVRGAVTSGVFSGRNHFLTLLTGIVLGYLILPFVFDGNKTADGRGGVETVRTKTESPATPQGRENLGSIDDDDDDNTQSYYDEIEPSQDNTKPSQSQQSGWQNLHPDGGTASLDVEQRLIEYREALARSSLPTRTAPKKMLTEILPDHRRMKILVTGGAGFVGSHLVDKLMMEGHEVIVLDNFFTGQRRNIEHWLQHPNFSLRVHDVTDPIELEIDQIYHLACPASPPHYQYNPVKTIKTSALGTLRMLGLAKRTRARILLASTSEVYGDPTVHPQPETYWGNVNTIGPRSCYDEGKRVAETMMYSYRNQRSSVEVRVARIFNTFGPRMHPNDGRVVSNFIIQALQDKDITIYGDGKQTRSFQYVSDLVDGLHRLMNSNYDMPVNLGNPDEYTVGDFAKNIKDMTKSEGVIINLPKSEDDPQQRKPNITVATTQLDWKPQVKVEDGLKQTISYFRRVLKESGEIIPTGAGPAKPQA